MQNFQQLLQVYLEPCETFTLRVSLQKYFTAFTHEKFQKNAAPEMFNTALNTFSGYC